MAALRDIIIKIVPSIDDKQYKKDLQYLADNSATALEKSYRSMGETLHKQISSFLDMAETTNKTTDDPFGLSLHGEWLADMDKYIAKFREWQTEIKDTGFVPNDFNSKLYQAYSNVDKLYRAYQDAVKEEERLNAELQKTAPQLTLVRENVIQAALQVNKLESEFNTVVRDIEILSKLDAMPKIDPSKLKRYETITNNIQNLKAQSQQLYDEAFSYEKNSEQQNAALAKRAEIEKKIENQERALNMIGKDTLALIQQIKNLEAQLTFRGGVAGLETLKRKSDELAEKLEKAKEKHQSLLTEETTVTERQGADYSSYERAQQQVNDLETELVVAMHKTEELNAAAKQTGASFNQWRNVVWSFSRLLGNVYTIGLDIYRGARRIANIYMKIWNAAKKVLSVFKSLGKHIRGVADDHAKSFKQMLRDIFRYSFGIRSLFMLFRRLRKYIKEAFEAMAAQIPVVNAMLASLKSSLYALKGSLATAFEPILSAIAPALVRLIDLLAQAITYIGMFFAALTGRGFVYQAKKVAQTIGDAAGNAKELNKQLQGFDELNNLTTNKGSGSGGDNPLAQFEKVDVPKWIEDIANKVKQLWHDILEPIKEAWAKVGDYVVAAWKRAFHSVRALLRDIVDDFVEAWKSGLGEIIATRFFEIIGDIGNIIANIADRLREAWNYNNNGLKIWTAILQIIEKILTGVRNITIDIVKWTQNLNLTPAMTAFRQWLESLVPIAEMIMNILFDLWKDALKPILTWAFDGENSGIALFFKILKKFNDELNKSKIRENLDKIWQAVGRFGQTVGQGLLIFMNKMLGYLKDWLNSDDFTKWCEDVANWLDSIEPADIAEDLDQVWRIIKNIAREVWNAIKFVIDHKQEILDTLEWASEHIKEIAAVFLGGKLLIDVIRFVANIVLFGGAISKAFGAATAAAAGAEAAAGAAAGAAAAGATEVAGATAAAGAAATETGGIMSGFVGTLAALASVLGSVALGYGIAIPAAKALDPILEENQLKVDDLKASMDDTIPTYDEMSRAAREASRNQKEYAEKMSDMYAQLLKTHPELQNLKDKLEDSGIKIGNNVERLLQINDALNIFREKNGDASATLEALAEKYDKVDSKTRTVIESLGACEDKYTDAYKTVDDYNSKLEENEEKSGNLIKTYQSEKEYLEDVRKGHENVIGQFKTHWDIVNKQKTATDNYNTSLNTTDSTMQLLNTTISDLTEFLKTLKTDEDKVVDTTPAFTGSMEDMQTAMQNTSDTAAETGDNIVSGIKYPIENANFDKETESFFKTVFGSFSKAFDSNSPAKKMYPMGENILLGIVEGFKQKYDEFKKSIQDFYNNTVKPWFDKSKWTFSGVGEGLRETFEKAKEWIKSPINAMLGFVEKLVNGIIDGFNKMGEALGSIDVDIPDWVPEIGGKHFEFKMPSLNHVSIPRLAQGAVIPPNNEFLAVLGDQKHGTNIETPLDTMVQAFNMANKGGNEQEIALLQEQNNLLRQLLQKEFGISERDIFKSVRNQNNMYKKSTGVSALA